MELHPIFDSGLAPVTQGLWFVLAAEGEAPPPLVGYTLTYIEEKRTAFVIGGADPSGSYAQTFKLLLKDDAFSWDECEAEGFKARYEHAAFHPASQPNSIYVFGGADQTGNSNEIQVFDLESETWSTPTVSGQPPSPRTFHASSSACNGDDFYVFGGGEEGSHPVVDRDLHKFNAANAEWTTLPATGMIPPSRHGHVLLVVDGKVFVFGGISGTTFFDDIWLYDLFTHVWSAVSPTRGERPCSRAAHGGVEHDGRVYIFGGMCSTGALDDTWVLDSTNWQWSRILVEGPPPSSRLDFAIGIIRLAESSSSVDAVDSVAADETGESEGKDAGDGATPTRSFCVVLGGMDTEGNIFDDFLLFGIS